MQVVHSNTVRDARPERLRPVGPSWQTVPAQEAIQPSQIITKTLLSRDGRDGIGNDGKKGAKGKRVKVSGQSKAWIHPNLMEGIVHFTRAQFMDGNRSTAQWLLNHYAAELDELEEQGIYSGFQFNELLHQIRDLANRLDSRLDYFGNPVGWVPRLGTVANIDITRLVVQNAVRLIHFSNDLLTRSRQEDEIRDQLSFAIDQIHKEVENDRIRLADAHRELPGIQRELLSIQNDVDALNTKIRDLHFEVKIRYREREFEQNLFTGGLNILSGLTNLIPVGQPFVGQSLGRFSIRSRRFNCIPTIPWAKPQELRVELPRSSEASSRPIKKNCAIRSTPIYRGRLRRLTRASRAPKKIRSRFEKIWRAINLLSTSSFSPTP